MNYSQFFGWWFSEVNGIQTLGSERLDVEAPKKYPRPAACASQWTQPSLFGDDTHAVVMGHCGHESTDCTRGVVQCVGG